MQVSKDPRVQPHVELVKHDETSKNMNFRHHNYIPKKTEIYIQLKSADSILFVTGNKFVKSKFSHFNKKMSISEIYMVKKSKATSPSQIIINPSDEETTSITKENIKTSENIELNTLRIDNLYRDYYYRKNN